MVELARVVIQDRSHDFVGRDDHECDICGESLRSEAHAMNPGRDPYVEPQEPRAHWTAFCAVSEDEDV